MVFTLTFAETIAVLLDSITGLLYAFFPGFFTFMMLMLPILIFYRVFTKGGKIIEKLDV